MKEMGDTYGYKDDQTWFEGEQDSGSMIVSKLLPDQARFGLVHTPGHSLLVYIDS